MTQSHFSVRRATLKVTTLGLGGIAAALALPHVVFSQDEDNDSPFQFVSDPENPTELEAEHIINLRLPVIAEDGSNVPLVVSMENHPMEPDHYIKRMQIYNFADPIVGKGLYTYSPINGQAYIANQMRMDGGDAAVFVVAECSQHGLWAVSGTLKVSLGGC